MDLYLDVLKKYAQFHGRARRKEYWYFQMFTTGIVIILVILDVGLGTFSDDDAVGLLSGLYSLMVFLPSLAVSVRRLHDTDRSAWWLLVALIPVIGVFVLVYFMAQDSTPGQNRYGANPKWVVA
jgi:uncharacterized membrane protein YhaH (DUF805 family)